MRHPHLPLLAALALALGGCASLSKDQCLSGDWRQIGFNDGLKGYASEELDKHAKACAEYGVQPQFDQYHEGRSRGLLNYCQPDSAFNQGRAGNRPNAPACPPNMRLDFETEYRRGAEIYAMESELGNLRGRLGSNDNLLHANNRRINEIRATLDRAELGADARKNLLNEFNRLVNDNNNIVRDNDYLRRDIERRYDMLRRRLNDFGR
ncbi:DUF2799 domain-containing protein [Janthinobacterium sp.]|uniref:DUF2799 domain-containing protein n=1 Tax=Janthinobacterium sp. TaxID=1871054 RepID=UPI00293D8B46|nr:DUF2799 domain-containing protein [Janthinobacterium sp.]